MTTKIKEESDNSKKELIECLQSLQGIPDYAKKVYYDRLKKLKQDKYIIPVNKAGKEQICQFIGLILESIPALEKENDNIEVLEKLIKKLDLPIPLQPKGGFRKHFPPTS